MNTQQDEMELLEQAKQGNQNALSKLVWRYYAQLVQYARRCLKSGPGTGPISGEDLTQETFLEVLRDFPQFNGESLPEFKSWLWQINARKVLKYLRDARAQMRDWRRQRSLNHPRKDGIPWEEVIRAPQSSVGQKAARKEQVALLEKDLEQLPEDQQMALVLKYQGGLQVEEIAELLGRTVPAVYGLMTRAKHRLVTMREEANKRGELDGE